MTNLGFRVQYTKHISEFEVQLQWERFCSLGFIEMIKEVVPSFVLLEVKYEREDDDVIITYDVESLSAEDEIKGMRAAGRLFNAWRGLFAKYDL